MAIFVNFDGAGVKIKNLQSRNLQVFIVLMYFIMI